MKICIVGDSDSIHNKRWGEYFIDKGYEVHVITEGKDRIDGATMHYIFRVFRLKNKINLIIRPIIGGLMTWWFIRKIKPDVVHAQYAMSYGLYAACSGFHPLVVGVWGDDVLITPNKSKLFKYIINFVITSADYITTFSECLSKRVHELHSNSKNICVILPWNKEEYSNNDISNDLIKSLNIPDDAFVVLSPRNMMEMYRIKTIVECIPKIKHAVVFIFVKGNADEKYFNNILLLIKNRGINNIKILDRWLSNDEMKTLYTLSDITISLPITDELSASVREAILCKSHVIIGEFDESQDINQYKELLNLKCFVSGNDSTELSDKINYYITHKAELEKEVTENYTKINEYCKHDCFLDKMEKIYIELINGNK